jgi:hypothetical protein
LNAHLTPRGGACIRAFFVLALLTALTAPSSVRADEGGVDLRSGGRLNGLIMAVLPGEHVLVRLADETVITVAWADVVRVFDGPRVFDGDGGLLERPPAIPEPPSALAAPAVARSAPAVAPAQTSDDLRLLLAYESLPSRTPSSALITGGILFTLNGLGMFLSGAIIACFDGCGFSPGMISGGVLSMGIGSLMFYGASRRTRARARAVRALLGIPDPEQELATRRRRPTRISVGGRMDHSGFVPSLTLAF